MTKYATRVKQLEDRILLLEKKFRCDPLCGIQGFDSMADAVEELGLGKFFYYNQDNTDSATPGSVHYTIAIEEPE